MQTQSLVYDGVEMFEVCNFMVENLARRICHVRRELVPQLCNIIRMLCQFEEDTGERRRCGITEQD